MSLFNELSCEFREALDKEDRMLLRLIITWDFRTICIELSTITIKYKRVHTLDRRENSKLRSRYLKASRAGFN